METDIAPALMVHRSMKKDHTEFRLITTVMGVKKGTSRGDFAA